MARSVPSPAKAIMMSWHGRKTHSRSDVRHNVANVSEKAMIRL
jgi:hypothetical protein